MRNYIQRGETITANAPRAVASGEFTQLGSSIGGVAAGNYPLGESGEFVTKGVFDLAKTAGQAIGQWVDVYWNNATFRVTTTAAGNLKIGVAMLSAAAIDGACQVRVNL